MNAALNAPGKLRMLGKSLLVTPFLMIASLRDNPDQEWKLRLWFSLGIIAETFGFGLKGK
jgi:tellurite resistance protein TehA-like permease